MSGAGKIVGVLLLVISLALAGFGAAMMFWIVPNMVENTPFPSDFDDHYVYGGTMDRLNTTTGSWENTKFTVDRHIKVDEDLGGGELKIDERIGAVDNTSGEDISDLASHNVYHVDDMDLTLSYVTNNEGYEQEYTEQDDVNWIFPHPVDKDKVYRIWNMNILDWSETTYLGTEDRGGVECYVFRGEETDYEVPLPPSTAAALGSLASNSTMRITLWEKAWVHPMTGEIIDYQKELKTYLYLPPLPEVPEIRYPSDLTSTTGFEGDLVLFDQDSASFMTFDGITTERFLEVISSDGYNLTAYDNITVRTAEGAPLSLLDSSVQVVFDARDGTHVGPGRSGQFLFSPQGVEARNYSIWDDGFNMELNAEYTGQETEAFAPLTANIYHIYVENGTYMSGGTATLDMTYWVEPQTGIVLDVNKKLWNWRQQDARRLPLDTDMINKTVTLNATITIMDPIEGSSTPMEIYVEQMINCSGYTNETFGVAKITETVTKYLPNGTMMAPPEVSTFGVDARTMAYVHVDNWSSVDRDGVFTFPIGLLNDTGDVTPSFLMYNSDLGISAPVELVDEMDMSGLQVAKYEMNLSGIELDYGELMMVLGRDPGLPGATGTYGCLFEYYVDIDTGTIVDISRNMIVHIVPPTYEYLYDHLNSTTVLTGQFMGENVTITQTLLGEDAGEGYTNITVSKTFKKDDGTDFLPPVEGTATIDVVTHEVVNSTFEGQGYFSLFPTNPTQNQNYTFIQMVAGVPLVGLAELVDTTETTAQYNWTAQSEVPGELFGVAGYNFTLTLTNVYIVDLYSGSVLNTSMILLLENGTFPFSPMEAVFEATEETLLGMELSNKVLSWAVSGVHAPVLEVSMDLYDMEADAAVMKAAATGQLLLIADGRRPALELELSFNETTKATMLATAAATKAQLDQLPLLVGAHMLDDLLKANDNLVLYVFYEQVDEDVEVFDGVDGSVEYWGEQAKEAEDTVERLEVTLPTILYVLAGIGIVIGIVLLLAKGKRTEEAEE